MANQDKQKPLEEFRKFAKDSDLTEEDALRLGREVNKGLAKRYPKK